MTADTNLAAPVLVVSHLKEAIQWYSDALGFTTTYINREEGDETGKSWNYALICNADVELHLCAEDASDPVLSSPSSCYLFLNEIEQLYHHLQELNADVSDLKTMPWGNTECWLNDPYGNRIVLSCVV